MTLSFDIMLDILLMVVIGGMGTLYGAVLGAAIFVLARKLPAEPDGDRRAAWPRACRCCR